MEKVELVYALLPSLPFPAGSQLGTSDIAQDQTTQCELSLSVSHI